VAPHVRITPPFPNLLCKIIPTQLFLASQIYYVDGHIIRNWSNNAICTGRQQICLYRNWGWIRSVLDVCVRVCAKTGSKLWRNKDWANGELWQFYCCCTTI